MHIWQHHIVSKELKQKQMPHIEPIGDEADPPKRSPLEEAFYARCAKENSRYTETISYGKTKLTQVVIVVEQRIIDRPGMEVALIILPGSHRH
jgi:hypothetical protein